MALQLFANNATGYLASSITNVATTITVQTGQGATFPSPTGGDYFFATLFDGTSTLEIVKVTARSADTFTVTRAQQGTTASAFASGSKFELRATRDNFTNFAQLIGDQTIAGNKTFSGSTSVAGLINSGNLAFSGTSNRITGDFSNTTIANRVMFQTSTANGNTVVSAVPNGTATISSFRAYDATDPTNSQFVELHTGTGESRLSVDKAGTGIYNPLTFYTGGAERMRIDTSGNLGVGTGSPGAKLDVNGSIKATAENSLSLRSGVAATRTYIGLGTNAGAVAYLGLAASGGGVINGSAAGDLEIASDSGSINFSAGVTRSSISATINSSGNLGLGVTPSAWVNGTKALQVRYSSFYTDDNNGFTGIGFNTYASGTSTDTYQLSLAAAKYTVRAGTHNWYTAPSGTAGNPITWTQAMTLDASGNLLVGTTGVAGAGGLTIQPNVSSGAAAAIFNRATTTGTSYVLDFRNANSTVGYIAHTNTTTTYSTSSDYRLKENVQPMIGALAKVVALKPCTYTWKADGSVGEGFIAHELAEVVPQCVTGEKDAVDEEGNPVYQGIDTSFLVATLTAAIQELKAEFDAYKAAHP